MAVEGEAAGMSRQLACVRTWRRAAVGPRSRFAPALWAVIGGAALISGSPAAADAWQGVCS